jgi:hypothetical protein
MTRARFLRLLGVLLSLLLVRPVPAQAPTPNVAGTWAFEVVTENGTGTPTVILKQEGDKITGTYESTRGVRPVEGTVKGNTITFTAKSPQPGGVDLLFTGTLTSKDAMSGTADFSGQGSATFSAVRKT